MHAQGVRELERSHARSGCLGAGVLTHTFGVSRSWSAHTHVWGVREPERSYTCLGCPGARAVFGGDLMTRCMGQGAFEQQQSLTVGRSLAEWSPVGCPHPHPRVISHQILQLADLPEATPWFFCPSGIDFLKNVLFFVMINFHLLARSI